MPIRYEWMQGQKDIILVVIEGEWGWEEFYSRHKEYLLEAASIERRVDFVFDFSSARTVIPTGGFGAVKHLSKTASQLRYWGVSALVLPNKFFRTIINTFRDLYPDLAKRYRVAQTVEEALVIIAKERGE